MGKLKLSLDSLRVTSFETDTAARRESGTVHAHAGETTPESPCRFSVQPGCPQLTGPCTGPGCDVTLAVSCIECASFDGVFCP
ncbi:MAG TPA: hypothetical protein VFR81_29720 [Longimicrobium sp.]|nr:hypothetical protein [Longimicrobium sp.]